MLTHRGGMMTCLRAAQVLLKNFANLAETLTKQLKEASEEVARRTGRPIRYLPSSVTNMEPIAREIAPADDVTKGLICILTAVEVTINGFRNRDLRELLFEDADASAEERRRHAAPVPRKLASSRMHRLIRKVSSTHRYHLTVRGRIVVTAMITARNTSVQKLTRLAA